MKNKIMLIDGHSLMYRAFYAMSPAANDEGVYTNAVYGFINMLIKAIEDYKPTHIVVAFDVRGDTFRNEMYKEYKANRSAMPEELRPQFDIAKKVLTAMEIKIIEASGYEADDVLGTLSNIAQDNGMKSLIVSGDKDILQLVNENINVIMTKKGLSEIEIFDDDMVYEKYTLKPNQIIDMKGLMGDSSDNIPGVKGVGEKTAIKLLSEYNTLENVYENIEEIKGKLKEKLIEDKDNAYMSKKLATIKIDVEIDVNINECTFVDYQDTNIIETLEEINFSSIITRIKKISGIENIAKFEVDKIVNIEDESMIDEMLSEINRADSLAFYKDKDCFYLSNHKSEYVFSLIIDLLGNGFELEYIFEKIANVLNNAKSIVVYNLKDWITFLEKANIEYDNKVFDVFIGAYILNHNIRRGYDYLVENQMHTNAKDSPSYILFELEKKQKNQIKTRRLDDLYYKVELPLTSILYEMEQDGFRVNKDILKAMGDTLDVQIADATKKIYAVSNGDFNINSPKQLGVVLFETLGLDVIKKTKTGYSTDAYVLEKLYDAHEIIPFIIEYRHLTKLKTTYIDGIIPIIDRSTGKLHTKLNQTGAITGRLSSSEPNLQNIPIRHAQGREIRKAFLPSSDDHILISADYSQIELRVLAHIAKEDNMIAAFKENMDIHTNTAAQVYDVKIGEVTKAMRSSAKAVNFGIVYGISDFGLAKQLNIPTSKAAEFINKYLEAFPGIKSYMDSTIKFGRDNGYVKTLYNRRVYLPDLKATNYNRRSAAERIAMNAPIQGSAADIIKLAMIEVYNEIEKSNLKSRLILQVHDELIIDTLKQEKNKIKEILKSKMENICQLSCPLIVDISEGKNWYEAK